MRLFLALVVVAVIAGVPDAAFAARIYLDALPEQNRLDTFYVPVRIDTGGLCINAVQVDIIFDPAELTVLDVARGRSILSLFAEGPTIDKNGTVSFAGGIPGGYCGRVEGDPGQTDILAELVVTGVVRALEAGARASTELRIASTTAAYLHDGSGDALPLELGASLLTLTLATSTADNRWLADVKADTIAPELFEILLSRDTNVAQNRWFISFSTVDKQSGVSHYEVMETDPERYGFLTWVPREAYWVPAESPYILRDQNLQSKILVKAVDKNGNERVVEYTPPISPLTRALRYEVLIIVVLFGVFVIGAALYVMRRKRHVPPTV